MKICGIPRKIHSQATSAVEIVWTAHWSRIFVVVVLLFSRLFSLRTIDVTSEKERYHQKENSSKCAPSFI